MQPAQHRFLPDGRRLHLHHGPIDLIVDAEGEGRRAALAAVVKRFQTVMRELASELPLLRSPMPLPEQPCGDIAARMVRAVKPHADTFVTPMAAVAGAVADEMLATIRAAAPVSRAYVNNGGDVALHLRGDARYDAAFPGGRLQLSGSDGVGGVATSGWRGRSHSLGIADAVTVLAPCAADADAAATLIANAVDLPGHPGITRVPAGDLAPDSDLGPRPVTVGVDALTPADAMTALDRGRALAARLRRDGVIRACALVLGPHVVAEGRCGFHLSQDGARLAETKD